MKRGLSTFLNHSAAIFLVALAAACMAGCRKKAAAGGPPAGAMAVTVTAAEAKRQAISEKLAVVGTLAANEFIEVKSEVDGTVAEIGFQEGQPVKKGDLLVRLDETKFAAGFAQAEANLKLSEATFKRVSQLVSDKTISPQEFDEAAATLSANQATVTLRKRDLQDARILAPFNGIAGSRSISPGQVISKNTTLTWIVDLDTVKAEFNVPERFISEVKIGQQIELTVAAFPKEKFKGEVYFLAPQVDPTTRTLLVKARVPNPNHSLRPGMFASLDLTLQLRDAATVIPESAILSSGDRTVVYVIGADSTAQIRPVKIGVRLPNQVEILSGVQAGEKVVAEGLQKVRPGGAVKIASMPTTNAVATKTP
jgi:membrane fusion protein, multidrug efflux system